jgi:hypothetical protein
LQEVGIDKDPVQVVVVALAGVGEGHGPAVLVSEPGQDVTLGLLRGGGGDAFAVALDVGEPQQPQELRGGGVGQPQGLVLEEAASDTGAVVGLQGVDGLQPQLGGALAAEMGGKMQGGEGIRVGGMEVDRVAVGFAVWRR